MRPFAFRPKLISSLREYSRRTFAADLMAGIIVGIVALPLAIAFGIASGVSPEKGIITAVIAGFVVSLLGGSRVQIGGPTGAFIVIVYGIIQQYGEAGLLVATLMAGVLLVLMGLFRLGTVIKFIPYPIVVGFTAGIALTIFTTQIPDLLGLDFGGEAVPGDFIGKWGLYVRHAASVDPLNALVGVLSILLIVVTPRFVRRIPGSLVAIVLLTAGVWLLRRYAGIEGIDTIGDRFTIRAELPAASLPAIDWQAVRSLLPAAFTIAVLGAIESLLSATVADGVTGDRHDSNTELIAQGAANLLTPLFGGIPATGAIARTMTNINNGGRTPVAGIVHAVVLLLILLLFMPLAQYIPMACLAGVLAVVAYNMSGWRTFAALLRNPRPDVTVLLVTFLLTVVFDLTVAIEAGLLLACVLFMRRVMDRDFGHPQRDRPRGRTGRRAARGAAQSARRSGGLRDQRPLLLRHRHPFRGADGPDGRPAPREDHPHAARALHRLDGAAQPCEPVRAFAQAAHHRRAVGRRTGSAPGSRPRGLPRSGRAGEHLCRHPRGPRPCGGDYRADPITDYVAGRPANRPYSQKVSSEKKAH